MRFTLSNHVSFPCAALSLALFLTTNAEAQHYTRTDLVTNASDMDLVNAWGLSRSSGSPWWVADNGTSKSTLYDGAGKKQALTVTVAGGPTGTVFNGTPDFKLPNGNPAHFLFAAVDGTISGWNGGTAAVVVATTPNAAYTGLAMASIDGKNYLFAADFHDGRIDVFDATFQPVHTYDADFAASIDKSRRYAGGIPLVPFNVQNIGGSLFVALAEQDAQKQFNVAGPGLGLVVALSPTGKPLKVFQWNSWLNAPWGVALAPGDFGTFSHCLLVGQFGSGQILAYNIASGEFIGLLQDATGTSLAIDGLWALSFGNGATAGPATTLYFSAGPKGGSNGLFGTLTPLATDQVLGNGN